MILGTLALLYGVIVYLGVMAYEVLLHLVYLLTSIIGFNLLEAAYIDLVKLILLAFMVKIKRILQSSSSKLIAMMNILIKQLCDLINLMFEKIKSKLLYYLEVLDLQIDFDWFLLSVDLASFELMLSELKSLLDKFMPILENVRGLTKALSRLTKHNKKFKQYAQKLNRNGPAITKVYHTFYYQNDEISKILKSLRSIKLQRSIELTHDKNELVMNLKINLGKLKKNLSAIVNLNSDKELIVKVHDKIQSRITASIKKVNSKDNGLQKGVESIKKILDEADEEVSKEIMSIIHQILIVEKKNLEKLNRLINQIQLKYREILIRGNLLVCTILFYADITDNVSELFGLMKFDCSDVRGFLFQSSEVEKYISSVSSSINDSVVKLAKSLNGCRLLGLGAKLVQVYLHMINIIHRLKFYVDLIAREILIFKMIILTLIWMTVISFTLEELIKVIGQIEGIDKALVTLVTAKDYLRAFYFIQLENTLVIFGLSNSLKFGQAIHEHYRVLLYNLDLINRLIWIIECYIQHLIVFMYVTNSLNSLAEDIAKQLQIITNIYKVISSLATITNKLNSIEKSINELKKVGDGRDITNFKESANKIRHETQLVSEDIGDINSQIKLIIGYLGRIYESFGKLLGIYYSLFVLISYVYLEIIKTNNKDTIETIIGNPYFRGFIISVLGPCNKQLMFILGYLLAIWLNLVKLINIVQNTMLVIYVKIAWLKALTSKLNEHVENINKGVVNMECAIEGVARNFIKCTLLSTSNSIVKFTSLGVDNRVVSMYSVLSVMDYGMLVNRMLEFWTFSDQSVEPFKYIRFCLCALGFETKHKGDRPSTFPYPLHTIKTSDINPMSEFGRKTMAENVGNHMCLCLVIKYHLRPGLLKCILYLRNEELGTLDTLSRKYKRYNKFRCVNLTWKLCGLLVTVIYEFTSFIRNNYPYARIPYKNKDDIKCLCSFYGEKNYNNFVSIILVLSSLIENMWSMDPETLRMSINRLSTLIRDFDTIDSQNNKAICNSGIHMLLVNKECQTKAEKKCCCWCVTCYNLGIILIYLCLQFKLFNGMGGKNNCDDLKKWFELDECNCTCQQGKEVCCLLNLAISSQASSATREGCQELSELLKKCCEGCQGQPNCCCKTLSKKVKDNNCKVLLLGCECACTTDSASGEFKGKIVSFKNPYSDKSVAMVVFCKCTQTAKECCCLIELIEKLKEKLTSWSQKICTESQCCCKELKDVCKELCDGEDCPPECPCSTLKTKLEKICNGGVGGNGCLCKQIKQTIGECFKKGKCTCKNKGCCRVLGASVRLLTRACKANVLEPYKRISLDLLNCGKNKDDFVRRIVKVINDSMEKKISSLKISYSSHPYLNSNNSIETRNWGYDTQYENHVTTSNMSENYPNHLSKSSLTRSLLTHSDSTKLNFFYFHLLYH